MAMLIMKIPDKSGRENIITGTDIRYELHNNLTTDKKAKKVHHTIKSQDYF